MRLFKLGTIAKTVSLFCLTIELSACVSLSLPKDQELLPAVEPATKFEPLSAKVSLTYSDEPALEDLELYSIGEPEQADANRESVFKRELARYFPISIEPKNSKIPRSRIFAFSVVRKTKNWGLLWIPALTLGIIPVSLDGEASMRLKVFDQDGKLLGDFVSANYRYDVYAGIPFLIPMMFSERYRNLDKLEEERIRAVLAELSEKCVAAGILKPVQNNAAIAEGQMNPIVRRADARHLSEDHGVTGTVKRTMKERAPAEGGTP